MLRRSVIALSMLAVTAAAAHADDVMAPAFRDYCFATRGDQTKALALAGAGGWMPIPRSVQKEFDTGFENQHGLLRTTEDGMFLLIVAHAARSPLGVPTEICGVYSVGDPVSGLNEAAAALSGVDGKGARNRRFFAWHEVDGKKVGVDAQSDEAKELARHGDITVILVTNGGDKNSIGLIRP